MNDLKEKLIMKSAKECTLCNDALVACFDESDSNEWEFSRELAQAITIQAGVELFTTNAIFKRLKQYLDPTATTAVSASELDKFGQLNKGAKATKVVNEAIKLGKQMNLQEKPLKENVQSIEEIFDAGAQDTVVEMLINTEFDDRIMQAIGRIDELLTAWEITGGKFYLDKDNLLLQLKRLQGKVNNYENTD